MRSLASSTTFREMLNKIENQEDIDAFELNSNDLMAIEEKTDHKNPKVRLEN